MKKISIVLILGFIILLGIQKVIHKARLKPYRVEIKAQDRVTKAALQPSMRGPLNVPLSEIYFSTADNAIICEWNGIKPTEIDVSSAGYSTQRFAIVSGSTNITALLEKIKH
jgi:hypothetical protein